MNKERLIELLQEQVPNTPETSEHYVEWEIREYLPDSGEQGIYDIYMNYDSPVYAFNSNTCKGYQKGRHDALYPLLERKINLAIAKYILEDSTIKRYQFSLTKNVPVIGKVVEELVYAKDFNEFLFVDKKAEREKMTEQTVFTETEIEHFKQTINGFDDLLALCEQEEVKFY